MAAAPEGWFTVAELAAGDVTGDLTGDVAPAGLGPPEAGGAPPCPGPIFPATKAPAPTEASTATAAAAISQPRRPGGRRAGAAAGLSQGGTGDAAGRSKRSSGREAVGTLSGALSRGPAGPAASSVAGYAGVGGG
jgi:hypothetical protein